MKKFFLSASIIAAFAAYIIYEQVAGQPGQAALQQSNNLLNQPVTQPSTSNQQASVTPAATNSAPQQTAVSQTTAAPKSLYTDGTYTGSSVDVYFGTVQVAAVISGGKLTDIKFLNYPQDRSTSLMKSNSALPVLKSEAIKAQNAQVNAVSGATETSSGFVQSLTSALALAKN